MSCFLHTCCLLDDQVRIGFQVLGQDGEFSPIDGYMVNFTTMKQKNLSTGYQRDVQRVYAHASSTSVVSSTLVTPSCSEQPIWCCISDDSTGTTPDGRPAFVTAKAKSTTKGVNANTYKPNYIFGKKSGKTGYYHITTKEAYQIVAARIGVRLRGKEDMLSWKEDMLSCCTCLTLGLCGKSSLLKSMKSEIQKLKDIQAIANARASATTPTGIVGLRLEIQNDQSKRREHYSDAGDWYFPTAYYNAAGGCGKYFEVSVDIIPDLYSLVFQEIRTEYCFFLTSKERAQYKDAVEVQLL